MKTQIYAAPAVKGLINILRIFLENKVHSDSVNRKKYVSLNFASQIRNIAIPFAPIPFLISAP